MSVFNDGLNSSEVHAPFWERQCDLCHLVAGNRWTGPAHQAELKQITGTVVSQELLWRKPLTFTSPAQESSDHLLRLNGLVPDTAYRFRLRSVPADSAFSAPSLKGRWTGLRPSELPADKPVMLQIEELFPANQAPVITQASLYRDNNVVFVVCRTNRPMGVEVEVQKLDGLSIDQEPSETDGGRSASDQAGHPPMRGAEDLTIEVCYQCHSETDLGTSHPVRLYGGKDVRIPDELPTVDGMLTCVTCHDPHGAEGKMLVREVVKTKLCVTCHYKFKNRSPSTMFR